MLTNLQQNAALIQKILFCFDLPVEHKSRDRQISKENKKKCILDFLLVVAFITWQVPKVASHTHTHTHKQQ